MFSRSCADRESYGIEVCIYYCILWVKFSDFSYTPCVFSYPLYTIERAALETKLKDDEKRMLDAMLHEMRTQMQREMDMLLEVERNKYSTLLAEMAELQVTADSKQA